MSLAARKAGSCGVTSSPARCQCCALRRRFCVDSRIQIPPFFCARAAGGCWCVFVCAFPRSRSPPCCFIGFPRRRPVRVRCLATPGGRTGWWVIASLTGEGGDDDSTTLWESEVLCPFEIVDLTFLHPGRACGPRPGPIALGGAFCSDENERSLPGRKPEREPKTRSTNGELEEAIAVQPLGLVAFWLSFREGTQLASVCLPEAARGA